MLYNNPSCSNSYHWVRLEDISLLLIMIPIILSIIYSFCVIINHKREKKKFELTPTIISLGIYLSGLFLSINPNIDKIYSVVLISLSSIMMTCYRKNITYLLLTSVICFDKITNLSILFAWLNLLLLLGLGFLWTNELDNKDKKHGYIIMGIALLILIIGIILLLYVNTNKPSGYCWSSS